METDSFNELFGYLHNIYSDYLFDKYHDIIDEGTYLEYLDTQSKYLNNKVENVLRNFNFEDFNKKKLKKECDYLLGYILKNQEECIKLQNELPTNKKYIDFISFIATAGSGICDENIKDIKIITYVVRVKRFLQENNMFYDTSVYERINKDL